MPKNVNTGKTKKRFKMMMDYFRKSLFTDREHVVFDTHIYSTVLTDFICHELNNLFGRNIKKKKKILMK